jgi:hypothetical protein
MRPSLIVSFLLALGQASTAGAAGPQALIWTGAKTEQAAREQRSTWEVAAPILESAGVRPAEGYPKLVESKSVPGLNPGFWVWVVGFCAGEEASAVLSQLKAVYPGAYAREVKVPAAQLACPEHEGPPLSAERTPYKLPGGVVRVVSVEESSAPEGEEPGDSYRRTRYHFLLTSPKGELLASESAVGEEDFTGDPRSGGAAYRCTLEGIRRKGSSLLLTRACRAAFSECGGLTSATEVTTLSVSEGSLDKSEAREDETYMECGD